MARARTWNLRLNLDDFNAGFASLDGDEELAQFLTGLSRAMNKGTARPGGSEAFLAGFSIGRDMREEAEGLRESYAINGAKGGRPPHQNPSVNQSVNPSGNPNETLSLNPLIPKSDKRKSPNPPSNVPALRGGRKASPSAPAVTLEGILGESKEAYWKLAATFGGQPKNPAPKTTALLYAAAILAGATQERIQDRAQALRNATSEEKFMPQLAKWLEGQGYLTPDMPKSTSTFVQKTNSRAADADASFFAQLEALDERGA